MPAVARLNEVITAVVGTPKIVRMTDAQKIPTSTVIAVARQGDDVQRHMRADEHPAHRPLQIARDEDGDADRQSTDQKTSTTIFASVCCP